MDDGVDGGGSMNGRNTRGPVPACSGPAASPGRVRDVCEGLREAVCGVPGARVLPAGDPGAAGAVVPSRPTAQVKKKKGWGVGGMGKMLVLVRGGNDSGGWCNS